MLPTTVLLICGSYLIGSISFAVLVSRAMRLPDPHDYGSGNPGATNVLRTGNRKAALLTLLGDALKGAVAVVLARFILDHPGAGSLPLALVGFAAFVGHLYPVFHGFRGGKGVATAAGVLLALSPLLGLATLGVWLLMAVVFRYSSLAALAAAIYSPVHWALAYGLGDPGCAVMAAMSALLLWRHAGNIRNLIAGREGRIGEKAAARPVDPA